MKQILKRDVNKRMVEATAFTALDVWWEQKEQLAKVSKTTSSLARIRKEMNANISFN